MPSQEYYLIKTASLQEKILQNIRIMIKSKGLEYRDIERELIAKVGVNNALSYPSIKRHMNKTHSNITLQSLILYSIALDCELSDFLQN